MTFWVVRAGRYGETEAYALEHNIVSIGWDDLGDLSHTTRDELQNLLPATYTDDAPGTIRVWIGEIWAFKETIAIGDLVAIPLKTRAAIPIGRITGPYRYVADAPEGARHQRPVQWIRNDLPRADFDQDILYSLGSSLAVFQVSRNNAEQRILTLVEGRAERRPAVEGRQAPATEEAAPDDLEQIADDQIVSFISRKFRGHELARLVGGVLTAQGYKIRVSPPGADGGVDILAGTGPMGFDRPRLAVQVKSSDSPTDVGVLRELQGVMPRFGAEQGLIVSWGGFRESVTREARDLYFGVRLWDAGALVTAIRDCYEKLPAELQAELPLRQIWTIVTR